MARNVIDFSVRVRDDASHNLQRISKEVDGVTGSLKRLAAGALTIGTGLAVARLADQYRLLQNRLRLVTSGTEELNAVTDQLTKISIRSRTSFQATADLFARLARSSRTLGLSQQELLDVSETVSKSIRISGSTAQEAAAGVIQFGQALASSRLSGDELRSVLEQMPRLAQAIAEGLDVDIGKLREMGQAGELGAEKVVRALQREASIIDTEFGRLFPLVSEAFTNLNSALFVTIGTMDEFSGVSKVVANVIKDSADQVLLLGKAWTRALEPGDQLTSVFQSIAIFALVASEAIEVLMTSAFAIFSRLSKTIGEFLGATAAVIATGGVMSEIQTITTAFNEELDNIWSREDLDAKTAEIVAGVSEMIETIALLMNEIPRISRTPFDLSVVPDTKDKGPTREEQAIINKAIDQLKKLEKAALDNIIAFSRATRSGREFSEELAIVRLESIALAAGMEQAGEAIAENIRNFNDVKAAAEAAAEAIADQQRFMEKFADQAARNIQTAFADFLFDPFEDGVKGMVLGFINAIRRMVAELLAFKLLTSIPGGIGAFFQTSAVGRAHGGPVTAGQPVLVGERGPELFIPNASGNIRNNSATRASGSEMQFITHIDARGADPGLIARMPAIMEQRDRRLMLKVKELVETGSVSL